MQDNNRISGNVSLVALLEAILFLSSEPLTVNKLQAVCDVGEQEIVSCLEMLRHSLENNEERGLVLLDTATGFRLGTKPELAAFLEKLWEEEQHISPLLSQAALETLAIIAVKQPLTRLEIEKVRGVNAEKVLESLLKRGLIKISGRKEGLGRPHLYVTTELFLEYFGLKNAGEVENLLEQNDVRQAGFEGPE